MAKDIFESYIKNISGQPEYTSNSKEAVSVNNSGLLTKGEFADSIDAITKTLVDNINQRFAVDQRVMPAPGRGCEAAYDLAVNGGRVIIPGVGTVEANIGVSHGVITTLTSSRIKGLKEIDATGKYVSPGIIDPHVHLGLFAPLEQELETETMSAAAGGITTIGCFLGSDTSHLESFSAVEAAVNRLSHVDVIPHLIINSDLQRKEIAEYVRRLGVTSFKLYMNGIPGMIPDIDDAFMLDVFDEVRKAGKKCIVCVHTENRDIVRRATASVRAALRDEATVEDFSLTHPEMAEEEAVIRLAYLAEKMGVDVYMVHMTSADAVRRLRQLRFDNSHLRVETTSPYLSLTNRESSKNLIKMEPPFRTQSDVEELWKGIEDGIIDTVGTDNVTMTLLEKNADGSMWDAMPGYPAEETHLSVLLNEGVVKRGIPIEKIIENVTRNPAEIFGVYPKKGTIAIGSDADLTIIDMDMVRTVEASQLHSRSDFSLYEGRTLRGWPVVTVKSGIVVFENGQITGRANCQCLKR